MELSSITSMLFSSEVYCQRKAHGASGFLVKEKNLDTTIICYVLSHKVIFMFGRSHPCESD